MWDYKTETPEGRGGYLRVMGAKYMVTNDVILSGGHIMQYTVHVSEKCTLKTYMILSDQCHPKY